MEHSNINDLMDSVNLYLSSGWVAAGGVVLKHITTKTGNHNGNLTDFDPNYNYIQTIVKQKHLQKKETF